jgi:hypothetical protein
VTITTPDFFVLEERLDAWGSAQVEVPDTDRFTALIAAKDPDHSDLDVTLALMNLVRDDLQHSGTEGSEVGRIGGVRKHGGGRTARARQSHRATCRSLYQ